MKLIPTTRGWFTMVDDEDYDELSKYSWYSTQQKYVCRRDYDQPGNPIILMHRFIVGVKDRSIEVDHKDRNPLNNQKHNIRLCNRQQQCFNQGLNSRNQSGFKGVSFLKDDNCWRARIKINQKYIYLGRFQSAQEAAAAYDAASLKYHGEFGCPNSRLLSSLPLPLLPNENSGHSLTV